MDFVEIDETNKSDFSTVLPKELIDGLGVSIGATSDGAVCGAISLSFDGEEYSVDWLYVTPSMRLKGIGRGLVKEVRTMVASIGICPIHMVVSASDESGLYPFLLSIDDEDAPVAISYSHDRYTIMVDDFLNSPIIQKLADQSMDAAYRTEMFWSMDIDKISESLTLISDNFSVYELDLFEESCEKDLCLVVNRKGKTEAFILVQRLDTDHLQISYMYSINPKSLACVLQEMSAVLEEYDTPQTVYFEPVSRESALLARRLFPDAQKEYMYDAEL